MAVSQLHSEGLAAFEAGDAQAALELLRRAVRDACSDSLLNDLGVVLAQTGDPQSAEALLRTSLTVTPDDAQSAENLAALAPGGATNADAGAGANGDAGAWRRSATLGGPDIAMPERAYPGMPGSGVMCEHAMRYALALGPVAGRHTLDIGCGTGYGSEMLTWTAASVRGFDLWQPQPHEHPRWTGGAQLNYGFDVCTQPLPPADIATMFEITEHLHDAPAALRNVFAAVPALIVSFPNPVYHGSHHNQYHVNDWTLDQFDAELQTALGAHFSSAQLTHLHQPFGVPLIVPGRDPQSSYWITIATGLGPRIA